MRGALAAAAMLMAVAIAPPSEAQPLFEGDTPLAMTLELPLAPLTKFMSDATVTGTLAVEGGGKLAVRVTPRGITRRKKGVCSFPPLRVDFADPPPASSPFAGQTMIMLTTHCRPGEAFQQYVLMEYLAYRLYNVLTPVSIRPQLVRVSYLEPGASQPKTVRLGFFTENNDETARRNGLSTTSTGDVPLARVSAQGAGRFAAFEYLIGNLDWSIRTSASGSNCCHNARLLGATATATSNLVPIPYDFDFAGLVDTPYATAPDIVPIKSVRQRYYRGYCRHNDAARAAFADMHAKRDALRQVFLGQPLLDDRARAKALAYLDGFFDATATPGGVERVLKTCLPG